ncbi:MAG: rod shape-determining protein MreC [Patescibacteria group bacterium]|nr:rod shape-determining protein MreC [Patescibacteria group bacterium]MDD5554598.1 rod shape-determining protein MreC [Patescibacteria group bacterium]
MAVIGLLIFLHFIKVLSPLENIMGRAISPVAGRLYSVSSSLRLALSERTDKEELLASLKDLQAEVNQIKAENARLKSIEEENKKLRQYLKFSTKNEYNYILANVVSRGIFADPVSGRQSLIVDKGLAEGLASGLVAVNSEGIIVGKIAEAKENTAKIYLATDSNCKLAASIQEEEDQPGGPNKTAGITEGELGLTIRMNFIPQAEEIKVGDTAVTSGLEKDIPAGLVIGRIVEVDKTSNEVWQRATIEPLINLDELTIVSVLRPPKN